MATGLQPQMDACDTKKTYLDIVCSPLLSGRFRCVTSCAVSRLRTNVVRGEAGSHLRKASVMKIAKLSISGEDSKLIQWIGKSRIRRNEI